MGQSLADCGASPAGFYCGPQTSMPAICPRGFYCPANSIAPTACPVGTFGAGQGLTQLSDCSNCFGGRYCAVLGSTYVSGLCDQTFYCVEKSATPVPLKQTVGSVTDFTGSNYPVGNTCEAGGFCPTGSKFPKPCPPGKYNSQTGKF